MEFTVLMILATIWGQRRNVVLDHTAAVVLKGQRLLCPEGRVIAERLPDTWQSPRGWHNRIVIQGEVKLQFEAPAYQFELDQRFKEVSLVGGTLWNCNRELIAYYDADTHRWRDSDNQQWTAIHFASSAKVTGDDVLEAA